MKSTQAQLLLGRGDNVPLACECRVFSRRPSSPFSLSMWHFHVVEPTDDEALKQDIVGNENEAGASGQPKPVSLPTVAVRGGAAIKAFYTNDCDGGGNKK